MKNKQEETLSTKIIDAVFDEYVEHEVCGYEIGCVLSSQTLIEKIELIIQQAIANERKRIADEVENMKQEVEIEDGEYEAGYENALDNILTIINKKHD